MKMKNLMEKERKGQRHAQVNMLRNYRIGDLPDIQIKNSDILKPLSELCFRDHSISQMFFASLASSIVDNVENEQNSDASSLIFSVIEHMNSFGFTNKFLASAFFEICLKHVNNPNIYRNLECQSIVKNCKNLNMEPLGIQMLLKKPSNETAEPSIKKARKIVSNNKKEMAQEDLLGMYLMVLFFKKRNFLKFLTHFCCQNYRFD